MKLGIAFFKRTSDMRIKEMAPMDEHVMHSRMAVYTEPQLPLWMRLRLLFGGRLWTKTVILMNRKDYTWRYTTEAVVCDEHPYLAELSDPGAALDKEMPLMEAAPSQVQA